MNSVNLMGRLTKDVELRYLQGNENKSVARFTIAVDKQLSKELRQELENKGQPTADFIQIIAWGKLADNVSKFTGKGKRVIVSGRIRTGSYNDSDGKTIYTTDVIALNVEFLDWKDGGSSAGNGGGSSQETDSFSDDFSFGSDFNPIADDSRIPF